MGGESRTSPTVLPNPEHIQSISIIVFLKAHPLNTHSNNVRFTNQIFCYKSAIVQKHKKIFSCLSQVGFKYWRQTQNCQLNRKPWQLEREVPNECQDFGKVLQQESYLPSRTFFVIFFFKYPVQSGGISTFPLLVIER